MVQEQNDSRRDLKVWLRALNGFGAVVAATFGGLALVNPTLVGPADVATDGVRFYAAVYAVRAITIGIVLLWLLARRGRAGLAPMLLLAGVVQVADAAIGSYWGEPAMIAGGLFLAVVHLVSAHLVGRRRP